MLVRQRLFNQFLSDIDDRAGHLLASLSRHSIDSTDTQLVHGNCISNQLDVTGLKKGHYGTYNFTLNDGKRL